MTREIVVRYHEEPEGWWAETEAVPGFSAAGGTFEETRAAVARAVASLYPGEDLRIIATGHESSHLVPKISDRGFKHMPPIADRSGCFVRTYESSYATGPHLWLATETPEQITALHLSAEDASKLRDQLDYLLEHHYQGRPSTHTREGDEQ